MPEGNGSGTRQYVLFVWTPNGYLVREVEGDPPHVGHELEDGGHTLVVSKIGASPFPDDARRCAYTYGRD
jgi:hypothetical protein